MIKHDEDVKERIYFCYVKYHDLKHDIYVYLRFDHPNDMIDFFHDFNPHSIDIVYMEVDSHYGDFDYDYNI